MVGGKQPSFKAEAVMMASMATWPEFNEDELIRAVKQYQRRVRKFGGLA